MYDIRTERGRLEAARLGVSSETDSLQGAFKRETNQATKVGTRLVEQERRCQELDHEAATMKETN